MRTIRSRRAPLFIEWRTRRRGWVFYALPPVLAALGGLVFFGWTECVAWIITYAPNRDLPPRADYDPPPELLRDLGVDEQLRVEVGPPSASICLWIIHPPQSESQTAPQAPRGTILFLHGIRDRKESLLFEARRHATRGYRVVLIDARGHGRSTGEWITYGVRESRDLVQVVDALAQRGLVAGKLGVYGVSFGASVGLQYAQRDPRVAALVAISPFSSLREVVPDYVERYFPVSICAGDDWIDDSIRRAGELGHFDPNEADCSVSLGSMRAQVLLIHGGGDKNITPRHSQRLHQACPERTRLVLVDGEGHHTITWDRTDTIWRESTAWFDRWLR